MLGPVFTLSFKESDFQNYVETAQRGNTAIVCSVFSGLSNSMRYLLF